ncbi:MAG: smalltalk protein [Bacteroidaceae bacterium]|nr:smalltalk protein [Bacteroidaceae bacterium]
MNESSKKTWKRIIDIVIAILTALITTLSANAAIQA